MGSSIRPDPLDAALAEIRAQNARRGVTPGNIDLQHRPRVKNADGSTSTVRSMSFEEDGREVLVPTVSDDGRILSNDDAIADYHRTGKFLGKFPTIAQADSAANVIHQQQAKMIQSPPGDDMDAALAEIRAAKKPAAEPGVLSRTAEKIGDFAHQLYEHPAETLASTVVAPIKSAFTAAVAPGVGEARPDARLSKGGNASGRAIDTTPYDAEHGGVTQGERTAAGVQTLATMVAPSLSRAVSSAAAPVIGKTLAKGAGLAAAGAGEGAAFNPDDPAAGALAGGAITTAIGGATAGAVRAKEKVGEIGRIRREVKGATPLDENVVEFNQNVENADRLNYGAAREEAAAVGGTTTPLRTALAHPMIAPLVEKFRKTHKGANASDAAAAEAVDKLLNKKRRGLQKKLNTEFDEDAYLQVDDISAALDQLRTAMATPSAVPRNPTTTEAVTDFQRAAGQGAGRLVGTNALRPEAEAAMAREAAETPLQARARAALESRTTPSTLDVVEPAPTRTTPVPPAMASYPKAVDAHAEMMRKRQAFNEGAKAAVRILKDSRIAPEKLDDLGEAALLKRIGNEYSPDQAAAFKEGFLGSAQQELGSGGKTSPLVTAGSALSGAVAGAPLGVLGGASGAVAGALTNMAVSAARNSARAEKLSPVMRALDVKIGNKVFTPSDLQAALEVVAGAGGLTTAPLETAEEKRLRAALEQAATYRKR